MMHCSCCHKQRSQLHPTESVLMNNVNLFLCSTCRQEEHEPRHLIILTARGGDGKTALSYIKESRYCGEPLLASEVIV